MFFRYFLVVVHCRLGCVRSFKHNKQCVLSADAFKQVEIANDREVVVSALVESF